MHVQRGVEHNSNCPETECKVQYIKTFYKVTQSAGRIIVMTDKVSCINDKEGDRTAAFFYAIY